MEHYNVVVIGAGHAGCEAALACARMGQNTLLTTLTLESVALLACNPSIGGTAKGQLVREVDALGGEMGLAIDDTFLQIRMLNASKGPAVRSLRAQADKRAYSERMMRALFAQENLTVRQTEVVEILTRNGAVSGIRSATGAHIECDAIVLCTGVYLNSRILIGETIQQTGPMGLRHARPLTDSLRALGFTLRRFKTGTPARIAARSIDFSQTTPQPGESVGPFSFLNPRIEREQVPCYLTWTTQETHSIIRENLHRSPMMRGVIEGIGARYCPSIEDKVVRFAEKERHSVFLEPETANAMEWYVQGVSTSLPEDVQWALYRSIPGLQNAQLTRLAYAIEYDTLDPTELQATLEARAVPGLFCAGQVNGSSGYEEAAAQGIYAGINAALKLQGRAPLTIGREEGYVGVLVDDMVTKGTDEPYRMMTSRAEYRLHLRQDNADQRLTEKGYAAGLASDARMERMLRSRGAVENEIRRLDAVRIDPQNSLLTLLRRPESDYATVTSDNPPETPLSETEIEQIEVQVKYAGYIEKQARQIEAFRRLESQRIPEEMDYAAIQSLRIEARQKLSRQRPETLGMASRIPGVSPSDISVLMVALERLRREGTQL